MITLCVPSRRLRDAIMQRTRTDSAVADLEVLLAQDPSEADLHSVRLWVPNGGLDAADVNAFLDAMPKLQVVQAQSAGVDRLRPLIPAGITLCSARGVHGSSTSEWALTAILSVLREIPAFERSRQARSWDGRMTDELAGKRVLIIGAGDVGQSLARRLMACDAEPVMVARSARDGVHSTTELPDLLGDADIVVLLIPQTPETIGLVDATFLSRMRDGALLVNGARGPIVNTADLLAELQSGRLRAALDVTDPEPLPSSHPLWQAPNLLLTPHVGGSVPGFMPRLATLILGQAARLANDEDPINIVTGDY